MGKNGTYFIYPGKLYSISFVMKQYTQPWPFINKYYRGICHEIIKTELSVNLSGTIHSMLRRWLCLPSSIRGLQSVLLAADQLCNLSSPIRTESQWTNSPEWNSEAFHTRETRAHFDLAHACAGKPCLRQPGFWRARESSLFSGKKQFV